MAVKTVEATPDLPVAHTAQISYTPVVLGPYAAEIRGDDNLGQYSYGYVGKQNYLLNLFQFNKQANTTFKSVERGALPYIENKHTIYSGSCAE